MRTVTEPVKQNIIQLSDVGHAKFNVGVQNKPRFYRGEIDNHLADQDHFEAVYTLTNILRSMERKMASRPGLVGDEKMQLNTICNQIVRSLAKSRKAVQTLSNGMSAQNVGDKYNQLVIMAMEKMMDAQSEYLRAMSNRRPITINRMGNVLSRLMNTVGAQAVLNDYLSMTKNSPEAHAKSFYIFSATIAAN